MDRIICVVGPTASGKTKLAVQLAKLYDGEVVSCDSMQIYKHMDIGTAKPTKEEMEGVAHHLIDMVEPGEDFSAGKYVQLADACVQDILSRGKTAVIAGGTGLYVDSLIAGRSFAPVPQTGRREALEAQLRETGGEAMLARLREIDPEAAARLHPADEKRVIRALEAEGVAFILPDEAERDTLMHLIYDVVKASKPLAPEQGTWERLLDGLRARGADYFILGCTELPIVADSLPVEGPFVDPTAELAKAAIRFRGCETLQD